MRVNSRTSSVIETNASCLFVSSFVLTQIQMYGWNKGVEEKHEDDQAKDSQTLDQEDFISYSVL